MDRKRHEDQYQYQQQHQQSHNLQPRANRNKKKKNQLAPTTPIGSTHPPPPLGSPGQTPAESLKLMQKEREKEAGVGGVTHIVDGDHVDAMNSNNNDIGLGSSSATAKAEATDNNHNANTGELSRSTSAGFVSASEGDDAVFGGTNTNANLYNLSNNSNSSSASATFTDAREESDYGVEASYQKSADRQNGNTTAGSDEGMGDGEDEGDDESNTPLVEEYTHASLIVNVSTDNTSVDFRERRERIDLPLPDEDEPLSSARSAPPDLSHDAEGLDDDDEVQFLYSSTPSRPQPQSVTAASERDSVPVVTLDSTLELDESVNNLTNDHCEEFNESKAKVSKNPASDVSSTSTDADANTTSTTLDNEEPKAKNSTGNTTAEVEANNSTAGSRQEESLSVIEEVQAPEVAAEAGLPKTVTILQATNGTTVYLVGTAHFSEASQDDVIKTIREVQPKAVFLELCQARQHILVYDEETILREASNLNLEKVRFAIKKSGAVQGALHLLLLSISCSITKKLGMAPGGEFRVGFREAQKLRHQCDIIFGDRAFAVTLARALDSLTFWQKLKLAWQFLTTPNDITKEEIERCKEKDILEQMLEEMVGEYPSISQVFVGERDIYLAHSLWLSALATEGPVVGIVGIGHVPGINRRWGQTNESQVNEVNQMPKTSTTSIVVRKTIKIGFYCLVGYGVYRVGARVLGGTRLQAITLPEALTSRLGSLKLSTFARKY